MPTIIKLKCEICDNNFERTKKQITNNGGNIRTCSKECKKILRSRTLYEEKPIVICDYCNISFKKKKCDIERTSHNFCSVECRGKFQSSIYDNEREEVNCCFCNNILKRRKGLIFSREKHFCNVECMGNYKKENIYTTCNYCGKEYYTVKSKLNRNYHNFCSHECRMNNWLKVVSINKGLYRIAYIKNEKYTKVASRLRGNKVYLEWRSQVKKRDNYVCTVCKKSSNLQVHHQNHTMYYICKKYDFDFYKILESKEFNDINNGITLCHKCHIKEHNSLKNEEAL